MRPHQALAYLTPHEFLARGDPNQRRPSVTNLLDEYIDLPAGGDIDFSISKTTRVGGLSEDATIQFRAEFFNIFNTTQFANPITDVTVGNFGNITQTSVAARLIQFALKYRF